MSPSDLEPPVLWSLLGGGFVAAFLHAILPTHWLPFVLVGRAQGWGLARTVGATAIAGTAHIASTAVVGSLIAAAGLALDHWVEGLLPHLSALLLFLFGAFYLTRAMIRRPVVASGPGYESIEPRVSDSAALGGLVALMALSPGEVLLPLYLTTATQGFGVMAALTLALLLGTVIGMVLLTVVARAGFSILRLERWARYEGAILGLALIGLGLLVGTHQH